MFQKTKRSGWVIVQGIKRFRFLHFVKFNDLDTTRYRTTFRYYPENRSFHEQCILSTKQEAEQVIKDLKTLQLRKYAGIKIKFFHEKWTLED